MSADKVERNYKSFIGSSSQIDGSINDLKQDAIFGHRYCPDHQGAYFSFLLSTKIAGFAAPEQYHIGADDASFMDDYLQKIRGRRVCFVDVCPDDVNVLRKVCEAAQTVTILDHHATTMDVLDELGDVHTNLFYIIDTTRSAAEIAYDWCTCILKKYLISNGIDTDIGSISCEDRRFGVAHSDQLTVFDGKRPWFIQIIADRDMNRWQISRSLEIGKAMYKNKYYNPDELLKIYEMDEVETVMLVHRLIGEGIQIVSAELADIQDATSRAKVYNFKGHHVAMTEVERRVYHPLKSEIGKILYSTLECDFSCVVTYEERSGEYWVACRAKDDSPIDLTCKTIGAKGHPHAAGITIYKKIPVMKNDQHMYGDLHEHFKVIE